MRLLVVGGLGDHDRAMRLALPFWRRRGFKPHYLPFRWHAKEGTLQDRLDDALCYIDSIPKSERVCVIGVSAGGVIAALLLLARPERVHRIVTVGSPLNRFNHSQNRLLNTALAEWQELLPLALRARISTFRAKADEIVKPAYSVVPGAYNQVLPTKGHFWTIAMALTCYGGRLAAHLRQT